MTCGIGVYWFIRLMKIRSPYVVYRYFRMSMESSVQPGSARCRTMTPFTIRGSSASSGAFSSWLPSAKTGCGHWRTISASALDAYWK